MAVAEIDVTVSPSIHAVGEIYFGLRYSRRQVTFGERDLRTMNDYDVVELDFVKAQKQMKHSNKLSSVSLLLPLLLIPCSIRGQDTTPYSVGVAKVDITPDYPVRLNGFGGRRQESDGVSQRIYATALAISHLDSDPLVIVTVDSLGIRSEMVDEVARRLKARFAIPRECLVVSFTHSHCAPKVNGASDNIFSQSIPQQHQLHIDRYTDELTGKIEQAAASAIERREPATLSWGIGKIGFAVNRRTKGGPVDHDLPMLVVRNPLNGHIRAIYVSYACHCVTLSFNKISGDWAGYAAKMIERTVPGATALVSIGCGSDSNPSSGVTGDKTEIAALQGSEIATEVARLLKTDLRPITGRPQATLQRVALPLHDPPTTEQLQTLAKSDGSIGYNAATQLAKINRGERLLTSIDYPIQTYSFGEDLSIVFLAGEVCVDYSLQLKRVLDRDHLWLNAYCNDFCCYIPSERLLQEGGYGGGSEIPYFALPSTLKPGLQQLIVDEIKRQVPKSLHIIGGTQGVPPKSPQESLQCLSTHDELRIELVAAEPLIVDPVAIDFGPDGRLWVAEMNNYGHDVYEKFDQTGRVRWLRDTNGDGRFDKAVTFVDGLRFPTDVKVQPGGVLICDAPDILYATDQDGDGKADSIQKLYSGFEVRNAQARVNSLRLGLDNWLHGSGGLFGGHITHVQTGKRLDLSSRDFRFHPVSGEIEPATGRTQQGRCRNDWGDWFGCTNGSLLLHYTVADHYHRRNELVPSPPTTIAIATARDASKLIPNGELVRFELSGPPGKPTSACGLDIYRDVLLGEQYYGNAFTCEPVHQLVHRLTLAPNGVSFIGRRPSNEQDREFLTSTDRWFRPVQVRTGPDGAIWVVDMYRYVIEHRRWIPQSTLADLDVFAGQGRGRIYRLLPRDTSEAPRKWPRLDQMSDKALVAQLDGHNGTVRDMAQQLLVSRGKLAAKAALKQLVRSSKLPQGQLHALCTLDGMGALDADDILKSLHAEHPEVLRHAIRLSEKMLDDPRLLTAVRELSAHDNPRVRRQVAYSLGQSGSRDAAEALASIAASDGDDVYLRAAVFSSVNRTNVAAVLAAYTATKKKQGDLFPQLLSLAARLGDDRGVEAAFRAVLTRAALNDDTRFTDLALLLNSLDQHPTWTMQRLDAQMVTTLRNWNNEALRVLSDSGQSDETLLAALQLLGRRERKATRGLLRSGTNRHEQTLQQIAGLITADRSVAVQTAAVGALGRTAQKQAANLLLTRWDRVGPSLRAEILDVMLSRIDWTEHLLHKVKVGNISKSSFNAARRQRLLRHQQASVRKLAAEIFASVTSSDRQALIDKYRQALTSEADVERGRLLFRKSCSACHRLDEQGTQLGPDLRALTNRDPRWLLTAILDPNRDVDARYVSWMAVDVDGRIVTGLLTEETSSSIRLKEANGKEHVILRRDLDVLRSTDRSFMPEGLDRDLSPQDLSAVLAYISRFDSPFKRLAGNQPRAIQINPLGEFRLIAAAAEIRGQEIVFERPFGNIGYWHGDDDNVTWRVDVQQDGRFDVYLDFACDDNSAGNQYRVDGLDEVIRGEVSATGGWSRYRSRRVGTITLKAGRRVVSIRPDGLLVKRALFDLRELRLVPQGKTTAFASTTAPPIPLPQNSVDIVAFLLDDANSNERRQEVIDLRPGKGPAIISLLADEIGEKSNESQRRIRWIWRTAIAVGKRNDGGELRDLLDASLPRGNGVLHDWQVVVIGGGVINGISSTGIWPDERLSEVIDGVPNGIARWGRTLQLAVAIADDQQVPIGTRYDALRMIALDGWNRRGHHLQRYVQDGIEDQLQLGAISGLIDMQAREVAVFLITKLPQLAPRVRKIAVDGLLRTEHRSLALMHAIESGRIARQLVDKRPFLHHESSRVRDVAKRAFAE
jgi:putative membrane-bound dehydrogenase-like protein